MIRILVVDDRVDFRLAFVGLLEVQPDLKVVSQAGSLAEARTMLEGIDVALIDRGLPDGDGLGLMGDLRAVNPGASPLPQFGCMVRRGCVPSLATSQRG